jgi:hypothetical protein
MSNRVGRLAVRYAIIYLRRRYRRPIRVGVGLAAVGVGIAVYWASREVPEG